MNKFFLLRNFKSTINLKTYNCPKELVVEIQEALKLAGFRLQIDGVLGEQTIAAFVQFKNKAYLEHPTILGRTTVDAFLEVLGDATHPILSDKVHSKMDGIHFKLPSGITVNTSDPIKNCDNFTWGEATANGSRRPLTITIENHIIRVGNYLEEIRTYFDNRSITINSWYRPPEINRRVGGVSNSTHLLGHGVDFCVKDIYPLEVYRRLDRWHDSNGGLGKSSQFTHLDMRDYTARWRYGN